MRKQLTGVKWVKKENLHLTLKFLGEVDEAMLKLVEGIILKVGSEKKKFDFSMSGISGFPKKKASRVIFIKINSGASEVQDIMKRVDEELDTLGFKKEKSYIPHITIGRVRSGHINLEKLNSENTLPIVKGIAIGIEVIKSELTKFGPIYTSVFKFDFK